MERIVLRESNTIEALRKNLTKKLGHNTCRTHIWVTDLCQRENHISDQLKFDSKELEPPLYTYISLKHCRVFK